MRGYLSAELRKSDIINIVKSEFRREWEEREKVKLMALVKKEGRVVDLERVEKSVKSQTLTPADRTQRDKRIEAALADHERIFGALKRKREEEKENMKTVEGPVKRRRKKVSAEKWIMDEAAKNVLNKSGEVQGVADGSAGFSSSRPRRSCTI